MRAIGFWLIVVCATSLGVSGQQGEAGTVASIRALEHEWVVGQSRNDNAALNLIFDNALVYVEYGKLITKGDYLSRIKWASPNLDAVVMEPMTVRTFGNTAIVVGTYREKEVKGAKAQLRHWRFVDTWIYKKSGWVLVAAAAAPLSR